MTRASSGKTIPRMRARRRQVFGILGLAVCAGCLASATQDNAKQAVAVRQRAAFDLACPEDKVQTVVVSTDGSGWAKTIGATGCDHRATYVRANSMSQTWVMDSAQDPIKK